MRYLIIIQILFLGFITIGFIISLFLRRKKINLQKLTTVYITIMFTVLLYSLVINITHFYDEQIKAALNTGYYNVTFFIFGFPLLAFASTVFFLNRYAKKKKKEFNQ